MNVRSVTWFFTALSLLGLTALVAPGCGHSVLGDCLAVCTRYCETLDDCESYTQVPVDRMDCIDGCDGSCDKYQKDVSKDCGDKGVSIDGAKVDSCLNALGHSGAACRSNDDSEVISAAGDVADECDGNYYDCR
jgi:hypothetical protein